MKWLLITFTGIDGSGKSTLTKALVGRLSAHNIQTDYLWWFAAENSWIRRIMRAVADRGGPRERWHARPRSAARSAANSLSNHSPHRLPVADPREGVVAPHPGKESCVRTPLIGTAYEHRLASGGHHKDAVFLVANYTETVKKSEMTVLDISPNILYALGLTDGENTDDGSIF